MIKYKHIALWILGFAALGLIMSFASKRRAQVLYSHHELYFKGPVKSHFVTKNDLLSELEDHYKISDSLPLREINIQLLEERLDNHPSIQKAEVYSELNGNLRIEVWQHRPLARVLHPKSDFYLLPGGATMPLSPNYSAQVPLLSGHVHDSTMQRIASFWEQLAEDSFFKDFFSGLHIQPDGEWILYPRPGHHQVILGKPEKWHKKLVKLKIFYQNATSPENINSIKTLNLKFEDQVICRKR